MMSKTGAKYSCGCGRSPTGQCIGWHGLTEEAYQAKLEEWQANQEETDRNEQDQHPE